MFSHVILGVNSLDVSKKFYDAVLGTLVETAAYQRLDRDQLRTMTPRQIDQATRKLRKSLEVREHDRTAIDQAWQDAPRGEQITNDLAELERALGHRPGWVDYTAMLRERETEYLLGYDSTPRSRIMQTPSKRRRHGRRARATAASAAGLLPRSMAPPWVLMPVTVPSPPQA